jgi:DNA invertase Pin-like site-specific DNA recombinase
MTDVPIESLCNHLASFREFHERRSLGVHFVATTQRIDSDEANPTSRRILNLLVAFSEFERELIVERTRAGLARARRDGKQLGRLKNQLDSW